MFLFSQGSTHREMVTGTVDQVSVVSLGVGQLCTSRFDDGGLVMSPSATLGPTPCVDVGSGLGRWTVDSRWEGRDPNKRVEVWGSRLPRSEYVGCTLKVSFTERVSDCSPPVITQQRLSL